MARRKNIDIFFVLYLAAIAAFVVVSRERDLRDDALVARNEAIVRSFLPPVGIRFSGDTIRCYVDADSVGQIAPSQMPFVTHVYVSDIHSEDKVTVKLHTVRHDSVLVSPRFVVVGHREGVGRLNDNLVRFPVSARFTQTGTYTMAFKAETRRIHPGPDGGLRYRGLPIDTALVPAELLRNMEVSTSLLTVQVIDTSVSEARSVEPMRIDLGHRSITSAVGFEERNTVTCNLGWSNPVVEIVSGGGSLRLQRASDLNVQYQWRGVVGELPDSVVIEARVSRDAGGKDIARTGFAVRGTEPVLRSALPRTLYAGEALRLDVAVAGLGDESAYDWTLSEVIGTHEALEKVRGTGPDIMYHIPNSFNGKTLRIDARYKGRPYMAVTPVGYRRVPSSFSFPVVTPPTRIDADLPKRADAKDPLFFSASLYQDPQFAGDQPVSRLEEVEVTITKQNGEVLRPVVTMAQKGRFRILLASEGQIEEGGERVELKIVAREAKITHAIFLERE